MKTIFTEKAPKVVGPYSQAIVVNKFVFLSGQIGIDPKTGEVGEGVENQTRQVIENLKSVLEVSGSSLEKVVKTTCYLKNMNDYVKFNEVYGEYFKASKPARATVEVAKLPKDVLVEIDAVAVTS